MASLLPWRPRQKKSLYRSGAWPGKRKGSWPWWLKQNYTKYAWHRTVSRSAFSAAWSGFPCVPCPARSFWLSAGILMPPLNPNDLSRVFSATFAVLLRPSAFGFLMVTRCFLFRSLHLGVSSGIGPPHSERPMFCPGLEGLIFLVLEGVRFVGFQHIRQ